MDMNYSLYKNTLLFIPAYKAQNTLIPLFERIPKEVFRCKQILISDDASKDRTFYIAKQIKNKYDSNIKVVTHKVNNGYGGNQKFAYTYAIENGFQYVIMLHGDLQYAPEEIPKLLKFLHNNYDMVFGSRILGDPISGGMPIWRFLGNKFLTKFENIMFSMRLSEFHSGYRAYNCKKLKEINFNKYSNNYYFDTQILVAFHEKGFRIGEVKISTNYGGFAHNISFPKAILYGIQIIKFALLYRMKRIFRRYYFKLLSCVSIFYMK